MGINGLSSWNRYLTKISVSKIVTIMQQHKLYICFTTQLILLYLLFKSILK